MKHVHPSGRLSRRHLLSSGVALGVASLLGCGGGDAGAALGGGVAGVGTGGTGSFSFGAIRGFGSIVVGGVHYDDSSARVVGEGGAAAARGDLRLGMVVEVEGSEIVLASDGRRRADASSIAVRSEIEGPVSAIDAAAGTLTVLGQQVLVTPATVFDDDLPGGLAGLRVGQVIEVYGLPQADGRYLATRNEDESQARQYKLRGQVSALDAGARTFRIGGVLVSYADLAAAVAGLADGVYARVSLLTTPAASGAWRASAIVLAGAAITPPVGAGTRLRTEVEGFITAFDSPTRFAVNGITVDASGVRQLPPGLARGVRVEVKGLFAGGVLSADEVELEDDGDQEFELEGRIERVDRASQTFVVRGVTVAYAGARFERGTAEQLVPGVAVEVDGRLAADGRTVLAREIEFDGPDAEFELEGRVASVAPAEQTFVIAGLTVDYARARFVGGSAARLAPGARVEVDGRRVSATRVEATQVEFDD